MDFIVKALNYTFRTEIDRRYHVLIASSDNDIKKYCKYEAILLLALKIQMRSLLGTEFTCETALSAESALKQIEHLSARGQRPVAIVSDWRMPGMKGDEFLQRVRALLPSCCLILMTGYAENAAIQTLSAGL